MRLSTLFCALDDADPTLITSLVVTASAELLGRPNANGETLVHVAAGRGRRDVVRALAEKEGVDVFAADEAGDGPLIWAARQGHTEVLRLLLDRGADVNQVNKVSHCQQRRRSTFPELTIVLWPASLEARADGASRGVQVRADGSSAPFGRAGRRPGLPRPGARHAIIAQASTDDK